MCSWEFCIICQLSLPVTFPPLKMCGGEREPAPLSAMLPTLRRRLPLWRQLSWKLVSVHGLHFLFLLLLWPKHPSFYCKKKKEVLYCIPAFLKKEKKSATPLKNLNSGLSIWSTKYVSFGLGENARSTWLIRFRASSSKIIRAQLVPMLIFSGRKMRFL